MGVLANVSEELSEDPDAVAALSSHGSRPRLRPSPSWYLTFWIHRAWRRLPRWRKQFQSRKWFWFAILYQNIFAYVVALCIYQLGGLATGVVAFNVWTVIAFICLAFMLFYAVQAGSVQGSEVLCKKLGGSGFLILYFCRSDNL